jgi:hypothetical protein
MTVSDKREKKDQPLKIRPQGTVAYHNSFSRKLQEQNKNRDFPNSRADQGACLSTGVIFDKQVAPVERTRASATESVSTILSQYVSDRMQRFQSFSIDATLMCC